MRIAESKHALDGSDARYEKSHLISSDTRHLLIMREQELMSPWETNIGKLAARMGTPLVEASAREARLANELTIAPEQTHIWG